MSKYPSLIFINAPDGNGGLSDDIFSDILLDRLFSKELTALMKPACTADDISARQKVCAEILSPDVLKTFRELHSLISKAEELYNAYAAADTDGCAAFIFVSMKKYIFDFAKAASSAFAQASFLPQRFTRYFASVCEKDGFKAERAENEELYASLLKAREAVLTVSKDKMTVRTGKEETYLERIKKAAAALSLWDITYPENAPRRLSSSINETALALHPDAVAKAKVYRKKYSDLFDRSVFAYRSELALYIRIAGICRKLDSAGIPRCFPDITEEDRIVFRNAYDITLLTKDDSEIIPNDVVFDRSEPFFFLTGANGGGKTTYLRAVGVNALLGSRGFPMACRSARTPNLVNIFTHFPKDERFDNESRFIDEVRRVDEIAAKAGKNTIYLLNETYSSTSEEKAAELTLKLARRLKAAGAFGVFVIHRKGLDQSSVPDIPFLTAEIDENDGNARTYKIVRADGSRGSYAGDILKKYGLDRDSLRERFGVGI
ncbi:MAG: hypothetical protein IJT91_05600 [Clostridia bacterium]|nr:hypothetical protein [Clostridia bacterium]